MITDSRKLSSELKTHYDFIACGSGSSGSVVARPLAENADLSVLQLEAGGSDDVPSVINAGEWRLNLVASATGNTTTRLIVL